MDLHRCKCSGTKLLSAGLAQQHRRTRQAVTPKSCSSALVFGDCRPVCTVDLHRCKSSSTRLLSAGLAQQHRRTRQAVNFKHYCFALVFSDCTPVCSVDLHRCKCSGTKLLQLVWHSSTAGSLASSTEEEGCSLPTAAVHWCLVTASLYAVWISIGVNAVAQSCCQLVWPSSTEEDGMQFTLKHCSALVVTAHLYAQWISIGVNAVAQGCCQPLAQQHRRRRQAVTFKHYCTGVW